MDVPEPEQTPFTAVSAQTSKLARVCTNALYVMGSGILGEEIEK